MSDIDINQVLNQMRTLAAQARLQPAQGLESTTERVDFSSILKQSVDHVNEVQQEANRLSEAFQVGDPNVDLSQVMVAVQKASVSFQAITQVRNKLVNAYQEIMNMPI